MFEGHMKELGHFWPNTEINPSISLIMSSLCGMEEQVYLSKIVQQTINSTK